MALTAHYIVRDDNGCLVLRNHLLAFRVIHGKHDGKNLGQTMFEILKGAKLLGVVSAFLPLMIGVSFFMQLGEFTLDNASNCDTIMEEFLRAENIHFCQYGNCIRSRLRSIDYIH